MRFIATISLGLFLFGSIASAEKPKDKGAFSPLDSLEKAACRKKFNTLKRKGLPPWVAANEIDLLYAPDMSPTQGRIAIEKILKKREAPNLSLIPRSNNRDEEVSDRNPAISIEYQNDLKCDGGLAYYDDGLPGDFQRIVLCTQSSLHNVLVTARHEIMHAYQDNIARKNPGAQVLRNFIDDQITYETPPSGKPFYAAEVGKFTPNAELIAQKYAAYQRQLASSEVLEKDKLAEADLLFEEIKNFGSLKFSNDQSQNGVSFEMQPANTPENMAQKFRMMLSSPRSSPLLTKGFGKWLLKNKTPSLQTCRKVMDNFSGNEMHKDNNLPADAFTPLSKCFEAYVKSEILPHIAKLQPAQAKFIANKQTANCVNHVLNYCYEMQTNSADCWTNFMTAYTAERMLGPTCRPRPMLMDFKKAKEYADANKWERVDKLCSAENMPNGGGHRLGIYESTYSSYPYSKLSASLCHNTTAYLKQQCGLDAYAPEGVATKTESHFNQIPLR